MTDTGRSRADACRRLSARRCGAVARTGRKVLKVADFERRLVRTTADGIKLQPLYMAADAPATPGLPGSTPYVRGARAAGSNAGGWDIRQLETIQDPALANAAILDGLEGGATSIQLRLRASARSGSCWSVRLRTCSSIWLPLVSTPRPTASPRPGAAAACGRATWRRCGSLRADLNADPLGAMVGGAALDPAMASQTPCGLRARSRPTGRAPWRCSPTAGPTMPAAPARRRSWRSPSPPASPICGPWSRPGCPPIAPRARSGSRSPPTPISSCRSPSSARCAGSGGRCSTSPAPAMRCRPCACMRRLPSACSRGSIRR